MKVLATAIAALDAINAYADCYAMFTMADLFSHISS